MIEPGLLRQRERNRKRRTPPFITDSGLRGAEKSRDLAIKLSLSPNTIKPRDAHLNYSLSARSASYLIPVANLSVYVVSNVDTPGLSDFYTANGCTGWRFRPRRLRNMAHQVHLCLQRIRRVSRLSKSIFGVSRAVFTVGCVAKGES